MSNIVGLRLQGNVNPTIINYNSFAIPMTAEMTRVAGVAKGSIIILTFTNGTVKTEILPPLTDGDQSQYQELIEDNRELFEELKRLGD